ncbi:fibronectin type III-like domain-contianing protein, partial [Salinimicrobium oceani]
MSWPRNVGQIPVYYGERTTGRPAPTEEFQKFKTNYLDVPNSPLLPFGHGLSYTNFQYSEIKANSETLRRGDSLVISTKVTNTGKIAGQEVVQLYIHDKVRSLTPPKKQLIAFEKINLKPGESKT